MLPSQYSFPRYLAAKKSVDDRALNRPVWDALADALIAAPGASSPPRLQVLEIGAGIGTMLERMLAWGLFKSAEYTALDASLENMGAAARRLPAWAEANGWAVELCPPQGWLMACGSQQVQVQWEAEDLFAFLQRTPRRAYDLLVAHAFLDLVDLPSTLPRLLSLLRPGGRFYFSLNFDGVTCLEPAVDPGLDEQILELYHRSMDARLDSGRPSGDSRTGRRLFAQLHAAGARLLAAGASDWVVFPGSQGYPGDEAYFLHHIIQFIEQALAGHPELDPGRFAAWSSARHAQIERGELVYIAHQLDFVGLAPTG